MSKQEAIRNAARAVKAHGLSLPAELDKQIAGLENPQYRVAVVGDFHVGKSTLINRVFFGDKPLLAEGEGRATTAVAIDNEYGSDAKMEVYDWVFDIPADNTKDPPTPPKTSRTTEKLVTTVPNPTKDDVYAATVSSAMESRAELAKKRARVRIAVPNEALRGFTVIDTPGLDDPNQELLLDTTWRIIPGADVALLVVPARMLGDRAMNLLRKEIMGTSGISRLMVLVSCKPSDGFDAEQRKDVLDTIKAQLASIGRENIPVEMYCFDPAVEDIMSDVSEIRMTLRSFLTENALPGREEKVANLVRTELEKDLAAIAAKLATAGKSDEERSALAAKVDAEVARFKEKAERAFERFQDDVKALNDGTKHDVDRDVEAVFDKFYNELATRDDLNAMKRILDNAQTTLKSDLQDKISIIGLNLKTEITRLVDRYGNDMEAGRAHWNLFASDEFQIKKPVAAKVPKIVWEALEVILMNIVLPLGWITAIIAKIVSAPVFSPVVFLAKQEILREVKKVFEETKPEVRTQIMQQVDAAIQKTFTDVKAAMEASNKAQVEAIRSALADVPAGSGDRASLESAKADLEAALASL